MLQFLKRLFSRREFAAQSDPAQADYAKGDWTPIPAERAALAPDVSVWLQEVDCPPPIIHARRNGASAPRERRATIARLFMGVDRKIGSHQAEELPEPIAALVGAASQSAATMGQPIASRTQASPATVEPRTVPAAALGGAALIAPTPREPDITPIPGTRNPAPAHFAADPQEQARSLTRSTADWIDALKSMGEHLTEEELKIIRQQLA